MGDGLILIGWILMVKSVDLDRNSEWTSDHQIGDIITGVTSRAAPFGSRLSKGKLGA